MIEMRSSAPLVAATLLMLAGPAPGQTVRPAQSALRGLQELNQSFEILAQKVTPAVVKIYATGYSLGSGAGSAELLLRQASLGSGVILDPAGYIVTSAHVVEGARRVQVMLAMPSDRDTPGLSILKASGKLVGAQLVGLDRETDLAVLKTSETGLPFLTLGDSDTVKQGQLVFAFGSPLGLQNTFTMGVVSSPARQLRPEDPMIYIQTDAPINPGNSGGPLVDAEGRVVGINAAILSQSGGSEGIGFAAPSNIVSNVFEQIRRTGRVRRGHVGVAVQTISPGLAKGLGLARDWGAVVADVYPGGPAAQAGLNIGDIIVALDGKPIENGRQFQVNVYPRSLGETVEITVLRGSEKQGIRVPVVEREGDPSRLADLVRPEENLIRELGILALDPSPEVLGMLPELRREAGVIVAASAQGAALGGDRLQPGDVIYTVNQTPVRRIAALRETVRRAAGPDPLILQIQRGAELMFLELRLE
jgi:serine protease Do